MPGPAKIFHSKNISTFLSIVKLSTIRSSIRKNIFQTEYEVVRFKAAVSFLYKNCNSPILEKKYNSSQRKKRNIVINS